MKTTTLLRSALTGLAVALLAAPLLAQPVGKRAVEDLKFPELHAIKPPAVVRATLPDGLRLLLIEDHDLPHVKLRAIVRGGRLAEPRDENGLAELFGEVQRTGGTVTMSGDKVDELLDRLGASIETSVEDEYGVVSAESLDESVDQVLPLFAEFLIEPAFPLDKIDLAKTHMRAMIARRNDEVFAIARREITKLLYGASSPYARQVEYDDVDRLTRDELVAFHAATYRPDATIVTAVGDFNADAMKAKLEQAFAGWKATGPAPVIRQAEFPAPHGSLNVVEKKDVEQTFIIMGELGMRLDDPDYPAVNILSQILGGGMSSRLFVNVRTKKGLAYAAGGWARPAFDHPGVFTFFTSTKPATTAEALAATLAEIKKIREAPVTDEELQRAKDGYLNGYAFEYDSTEKIADRLADYEFYGYPADFNVKLRDAIEKVTSRDVLRAAQKYLHPDEMAILAIGRADQFDKPLSTFGKVHTIDITIPEPNTGNHTAATPESLARGKELLVKAAEAAGEAALRGLKDLTTEGETDATTPMGPMKLKGAAVFVLPDRLHAAMSTQMGEMVQVLDGDNGWVVMGGANRDLPASAVAEMRAELFTRAGCALLLRDALAGKVDAQAAGKTEFEGKDAEEVIVRVDGKTIHVFLSPDAAEVLGVRRTTVTQQGPAEMVEVFSSYRVVSGLRLPFDSVRKVRGAIASQTKLSSIKVNAGFDEALFKHP
jgi:zinc protease